MADFSKYCKNFFSTTKITCDCGFTYVKSEATVPSFSLNSCKTFPETYEENTSGRIPLLVKELQAFPEKYFSWTSLNFKLKLVVSVRVSLTTKKSAFNA